MANVGATSSKQNQSNINESQRDVFKRMRPKIKVKRVIDKRSLRNGIIVNRRSLL